LTDDKLIACIVEGTAERVIINKLLDAGCLIFSRNQLLDQELLKCRNAREFEDKYLGKGFKQKISVYRILDSRTEKFKLRKVYQNKVDVVNVITAPEIEILVILKENKLKDYAKYTSELKPSEYCIQKLKLPNVKTKEFLENYFSDIDELVELVKKYKRVHKVLKNESCIADLLKA